MNTKKIIVGIGIAVIILAVLVIAEIVRELGRYKTVHYQIETPAFAKETPELKIVFLSDLHNYEYGENNHNLVEDIRKQKPDLILCTGDMLVGKRGCSVRPAAEFMKQLPEIAPVYYANGNHEQRMYERPQVYGDVYSQYRKELEEAGVRFLLNEHEVLEWHGKKIAIYGLELPAECYHRTQRRKLKQEELEKWLGRTRDKAYNILLAHNPEYTDKYKKWGADLSLSGHLHGGIVRLPIIGGIISPQLGVFPKYSGDCYQEDDVAVVVSKGLGTHTVNIRLWNPAELIVLHVNGK